jgi:hypothetical protein
MIHNFSLRQLITCYSKVSCLCLVRRAYTISSVDMRLRLIILYHEIDLFYTRCLQKFIAVTKELLSALKSYSVISQFRLVLRISSGYWNRKCFISAYGVYGNYRPVICFIVNFPTAWYWKRLDRWMLLVISLYRIWVTNERESFH